MMQEFLDLEPGDKTMVGTETLEITNIRHSAAQITKTAQGEQMYDIVIDARDESVKIVPWQFDDD